MVQKLCSSKKFLKQDITVFYALLVSSIQDLLVTAQKLKFSIKYFFSKCDQIRRKLRIWSHLLKKSFIENFNFLCSVCSLRLYSSCQKTILCEFHLIYRFLQLLICFLNKVNSYIDLSPLFWIISKRNYLINKQVHWFSYLLFFF